MPILILKAGYLKVVDKFLCGRPKAIDSLDYKNSLLKLPLPGVLYTLKNCVANR